MINIQQNFNQYKDKIPQFILKLYHILEHQQYSDYICWSDNSQILIKSGKRLEQKVLPLFFRHHHLSSFVRQLNMYKFNKVNKLAKQKNYMYFRNEHFKRGEIQEMTKIKRNNKKNNQPEQLQGENPEQHSAPVSQNSLNIALQNNRALQSYKQYVKKTVKQLSDNLKRIQSLYPNLKNDLMSAQNLCSELMQIHENQHNYNFGQIFIDESQNKNMLSTMRLLPIQSLIFPSQCSFYQFN